MNPNIEMEIRQIEEIDYFEDLFEAASNFQDVVNLCRKYEDLENEKKAMLETKILKLEVYHPIIDENYTSRFDEYFVSNNRFIDEDIKYFENRLAESSNVFINSRYSDFLYEYGQG